MRIKIYQDYYSDDDKIYDKKFATFKSGLTILVGCNGSGKTTLLHQIKYHCKKKGIPCFEFDNYSQGGSHAIGELVFHQQFESMALDLQSSEGEKISNNLARTAGKIGRFMREHADQKEIVVLFDAIDSGLSIDNVVDVKDFIKNMLIPDCTKSGVELYVIASANAYELANGEQCFDVNKCQYIRFDDYDGYRQFIFDTRQRKDKRYGGETE